MQAFRILTMGLFCVACLGNAEAKEPYAHTGDGSEVWKNSAGECWSAADGTPNWCGEIPDSDGDGVKDDRDECPATPRGETVDERGCPPDTDRDGVPDHADDCPGTPYGVRVDTRGCALDLDRDGVPYYLDRCQTTPPNVEVDEDGCMAKTVLSDVLFAFDKAELTAEARRILDRLGDSLKQRDEMTAIRISGHTDSVGSSAYNQRLSQARADAVMRYLLDIGCGQPISARGYGESRPVASNATEEGRRKNRRVEIELERTER